MIISVIKHLILKLPYAFILKHLIITLNKHTFQTYCKKSRRLTRSQNFAKIINVANRKKHTNLQRFSSATKITLVFPILALLLTFAKHFQY